MNTYRSLTLTAFAAIIIACCSLTGCNKGDESHPELVFKSYEYTNTGCYSLGDTDTPADTMKLQLIGECILPQRIGNHDISVLRDSVLRLAGMTFNDKGVAQAAETPSLKILSAERDSTLECFVSNVVTIARITSQLIVWKSFASGYYGGAHGFYATRYLNYDINTDSVINLSSLMVKGYEKPLLDMLRESLKDNPEVYVDMDEVKIPTQFCITSEGLTFVYGIYEVAPYAAGEIRVALSLYELEELLTPEAVKLITGSNDTEL